MLLPLLQNNLLGAGGTVEGAVNVTLEDAICRSTAVTIQEFQERQGAYEICVRCGLHGKYLLTEPVTGARVHKECFDKKVISRPVLLDAEAVVLKKPRPETEFTSSAETLTLTYIGASGGVASFWLNIFGLYFPDLTVTVYVDGAQSGSVISVTSEQSVRARVDFTRSLSAGTYLVRADVSYNGAVIGSGSVSAVV